MTALFQETVRDVLDVLIDRAFDEGDPGDKVGVEITHPSLDYAILVPFCPRGLLSGERILHWIEKIQQSKRGLSLDHRMVVKFTRIRPVIGGGWRDDF